MRPDLYTPYSTMPRSGRGRAWPGGGSKLVKLLILVAVVGGLGRAGWQKWGPSLAVAGPRGRWLHDLDDGLAAGAASRKPVLVLYTADWCPSCRQLNRDVLRNHRISAFLAREFVRVKIDLTDRRGRNAVRANRAGISSVPTVIVFNHRGVETKRITGGGMIGAWIRRQAAR